MDRLETQDVLAGAYRGKRVEARTLLAHGVRVDPAGNEHPLCRVPLGSLAGTSQDKLPTCPTCLKRWVRLVETGKAKP